MIFSSSSSLFVVVVYRGSSAVKLCERFPVKLKSSFCCCSGGRISRPRYLPFRTHTGRGNAVESRKDEVVRVLTVIGNGRKHGFGGESEY